MGEQGQVVHVENVDAQEANGRVHAKTYILVAAVNMIYVAQLCSVVGSGALARDITAVTGGSGNIVWFTSVITICTAVLSPSVSQAADYWGRKWLLIFFTILGCVGSIVVSRANSPGSVLVGFTFSGLAFGSQALVPTITSEVLPRNYRPYAQAAVNVSGSLSGFVSLLLGGALTRNSNHEGFRTYWYICAGTFALSAILTAFLYNPPLRELQRTLKFTEKLKKLDWIGYALLTLGLALFCVGLSWSQNPYPWTDARVSAPFAVGVFFTTALVLYEWFIKVDGMIHHRLFRGRGRNFPIALFCLFVEGLAFFSANNYFPFETSILFTSDPVVVGAHFGIAFIASIVFAGVGAAYCWKTKTLRDTTMAAFISFIIFFVLMATTTTNTPQNNFWAYPLFLGGGLALSVTALMTAAQFATPAELISTATGLVLCVRNLGATVGLAVYNAVFNQCVSQNLAPKIAAAALPLGLPESSIGALIGALVTANFAGLAEIPGVTEEIIGVATVALKETYLIAFRYVWVTAGAFSAIAFIASCFLSNPSEAFNSHIDAPVEVESIAEADKAKV
ncbi:Uncharacterized protein BP5553_01293 [Venustampulla echinocandica]|uniref:Major facilitator superfamily (MFS) profile domain-containing protein n=1 Tax=Venustampulla echinocandica TaxID=2656787 RepID=A0A370U0L7_9HELO|nr:Uncharacterized protein BP5553_01293 [Venustampulla echinocandica]RDL41314.1 Uncharacterized protein BP5553_01293 [Venustampulla echinocandica]